MTVWILNVIFKQALKIEETGGGILVTFFSGEGVSERVNVLLECVRNNPGLRIPDYSNMLNVSPKTLGRWIKKLREKKKVRFKGSPRTGGYHIQ